jgi:hypothetical protein
MAQECFWMVLAENSNQTTKRHSFLDQAKAEAKRLAASNPGIRFFVLQSLGAHIHEVSWEQHDEIPF